ncbi:hypothetical protein C8R44DRAFT_733548 [Mycena epipterygia]|nr:hypothetical protein C8R44DRAFT_733548 [Mycena epipterygia]
MPRLSSEELQYAQTLGQELFDLERQVEEHAAILRLDPNKTAAVYEEYSATAPPVGFMPTSDARDAYLNEALRIVTEPVHTFLQYGITQYVSAAMFISRIKTMQAAEKSQAVFLKVLKIKADLHANHQYATVHAAMPAVPHPFLARELGLPTSSISQPSDGPSRNALHI